MSKYWLICIFLCGAFSTKAQFNYPDSLYTIGNYELAAVEYERIVFLNTSDTARNYALLKRSQSLKQTGRYGEAYQNSLRANLFSSDESLNEKIRYESVLSAHLAGRHGDCFNQYLQLKYFGKDSVLIDRAAVIAILSLNSMSNWDEAEELLISLDLKYNLNLDVNDIYNPEKRPKIRKKENQTIPLVLFPGYVLVREGEPVAGIASMLIKSGLVAYNVGHIIEGLYFNALFGGGLYSVVYTGNTTNAEQVLEKNNLKKTNNYNSQLKEFLIQSLEKNSNPLY